VEEEAGPAYLGLAPEVPTRAPSTVNLFLGTYTINDTFDTGSVLSVPSIGLFVPELSTEYKLNYHRRILIVILPSFPLPSHDPRRLLQYAPTRNATVIVCVSYSR
jgi:hypothetical protein